MNENNITQNTNSCENDSQKANPQELFNLIESIQAKLNDENNSSNENNINNNMENNQDTNINSSYSENSNKSNNSNSNNNNFDFLSILKNIDISQVLGMLGNNNNSNNTNNTNNEENQGFNIDASTLLKFQRVISKLNGSNPKKNLLLSLKPFLRKSRQDKLNEYITMLTLIDAFEAFSSKGSDDNV